VLNEKIIRKEDLGNFVTVEEISVTGAGDQMEVDA